MCQIHDFRGKTLGTLLLRSLGIHADDGFGIGATEMHPFASALKVHFHTVDGIHLFVAELFFHRIQNLVYQCFVAKFDTVLRNKIRRQRLLVGTHTEFLMSKMAQDKRNADHGIPAAVAFGIDDTAVAFASYQGSDFMHLRSDVYLSYGSGIIAPAMSLGHIAKCPAGGKVRNGAEIFAAFAHSFVQKIIRYGHKGIFFHKRLSVFANQSQPVHIGIHAYAKIGFFLYNCLAQVLEIGGKRLGIVGEISGGLAVEPDAFHAQFFEQARHYYATYGIHRIHDHLETGILDGLYIDGLKGEDGIYMFIGVIMLFYMSEFIYRSEIEDSAFRTVQNGLSLRRGKELPFLVKELEGVPLPGIVRCRENDAAVCMGKADSKFRRGSGSESALHHIDAAGNEGAAHELLHHLAAQAGIPPYEIKDVITVVKAYSSAVGAGPFVSEIFGDEAEELRRRGGDRGEYGATTGRPRRVGWFDLPATRYGCEMQGATEVALTLVDALGYLDEMPVCVAYEIDGKRVDSFPPTPWLWDAKPIVEKLPGWKCDIRGARDWDALPAAARDYVLWIERSLGVPVRFFSTGPGREDVILRGRRAR